ncbi:MAG: SprT-like domain-containing protein [Planctomycetes bacterium]|nr:SprT-like domain-containing protein [Planctomycetota bacterium]
MRLPELLTLPSAVALRERCLALFALWGVPDRGRRVRVEWSGRLTTSAGRADLRGLRVLLNPKLLSRVPDKIDETVVHEAAHLAAHLLHGDAIQPHGAEWSRLMRAAGLPPDVTHEYPVDGLRRRAWFYLHVCGGCGSRLLLRRVRRVRCGRCKPRTPVLLYRAPQTDEGLRALRAREPAGAAGVHRLR